MGKSSDFLLEIGTEELPPGALRTLRDALVAGMRQGCDEHGLSYKGATGYASPRRLAVNIHALAARQPTQSVEKRGPSVAAAFDEKGHPTRAGEGFARSCGVDVAELERVETERGAWLYYRATQPGAGAVDLLPLITQAAVAALPIAKRMRWGKSNASFIRPVHWIVALLGHDVVPLSLFGIDAGRISHGHRFHHPDPIVLSHPGVYVSALADPGHVVADLGTRVDIIREQVARQGYEAGGEALIDPRLLQEVAGLVEWPVALTGHFDSHFLELPREVLVATLQGHQRYFPVSAGDQRLLPLFVTVVNIRSLQPEQVRRGNERVVRPRLGDALFFWHQDLKRPLEDFNRGLPQLAFQHQLGSMADKVQRIRTLAAAAANAMDADPQSVDRAAQLSKADLLTAMVYEFSELQGTMGRYYARAAGETAEVAQALEEQYQPRFADDVLPQTLTGRSLAIADRVDTLAGIFALGQRPSGDKDPFGLRRAALGIVRILIERRCDLNLRQLAREAIALQPIASRDGAVLVDDLMTFFLERMRTYYLNDGVSAEMFNAVAALGNDCPLDFDRRIIAIQHFVALPEAATLSAAHKRIRNLLKRADGAPRQDVDRARLSNAAEKTLHQATLAMSERVSPKLNAHEYGQALNALACLQKPVDAFFDQVMVMSDDGPTRANRLALLGMLDRLCRCVADISYLPAPNSRQ